MVFVELTSGLGNQLFQYAMARSVAIKKGQRLVLDNSHFLRNKYRKPRLSFFSTGANFTLPFNRWVGHFSDLFLKRNNSVLILKEDKWWQFNPIPEEINTKHLRLEGGWCSIHFFEENSPIIQKEVQLKRKYSKRIKIIQQELNMHNSVAIHIRKGDYVHSSEAKSIFCDLDISYYEKAIAYIKSQISNPVFYIFTNDSEWVCKYFMPRFSEQFVHVSALQDWEDYEEFELIRTCKHQIIANSTFSWWAAFFNQHSNKIIIQPQKWYNYLPAQENYERGMLIGTIGVKL